MIELYNKTERIVWLDMLKTTAIIAMILLHVSAVGLSEADVASFEWQISNIFNSFCRFCVPIFIMISGAIFLSREMPMKKYITRMIIALIFWTVAYTLYASFPQIYNGQLGIMNLAESLCSPTHLWFLWMIIPLYLSVPIFRAIVKDKKASKYFLLLWIIFGVLIPAVQHLPIIGPLVVSCIKQTHFFLVLEYGGYFVLGYYLANNSVSYLEKFSLLYVFGGILLTIFCTLLVSNSLGQTTELFIDYFFPTTFLTSAGLFVLFKKNASEWKISTRMFKIILFISSCSLGVYAIHIFFLAAFHKIGLTYAIYNPIISIPTICLITLMLSMGVAYVIKRYVPKGNNLV